MKIRTENGFTLIEVLMASVILVIGIGIIGSIISGIVKRNFYSQRHTQAVILAQNKIEELLNEGYDNQNLDEGSYENPLNPVDATGDTSGMFYHFWIIEDLRPIPRSKMINSRVQWEGTDGETKYVTLTAVCIDQ